MKYQHKVKHRAIKLREKGFSLREISREIGVALGTLSLWLRDINISPTGKLRLKRKSRSARELAYKTRIYLRDKRLEEKRNRILLNFKKLNSNKFFLKCLCAYLYWGEGNKSGSSVGFINSDPKMIKNFMFLLRNGFEIDETKFRGLMHLHEYHDEKEMANFWSNVSGIPLNQFSKTYKKPHTGKRKKKYYKGSLRIRYYDVKIAQELTLIYNTLSEKLT